MVSCCVVPRIQEMLSSSISEDPLCTWKVERLELESLKEMSLHIGGEPYTQASLVSFVLHLRGQLYGWVSLRDPVRNN